MLPWIIKQQYLTQGLNYESGKQQKASYQKANKKVFDKKAIQFAFCEHKFL